MRSQDQRARNSLLGQQEPRGEGWANGSMVSSLVLLAKRLPRRILRTIRAMPEEPSPLELAVYLPNRSKIFDRVAIRANAEPRGEKYQRIKSRREKKKCHLK